MKKRRKKKVKKKELKITASDYLKAVKKANREIELSESVGWVSKNKVHKNKKLYNRKDNKKITTEKE